MTKPQAARETPCARYFGSDGTLCSTHGGRFAGPSETRCDTDPLGPCATCGHRDADHGSADPECEVAGCRCLAFVAARETLRPDPLTALREAVTELKAWTGPSIPTDLAVLIVNVERAALRAATPDPAEPGLRALFARYIEHHGEPAEWDTDDGWCQKHLPRIEEVQSALSDTTKGQS